jgi:hypothetical protein
MVMVLPTLLRWGIAWGTQNGRIPPLSRPKATSDARVDQVKKPPSPFASHSPV